MRLTITALLLIASGFAVAADNPRDLQDEMVRVENEYVALYNKLNTDDQFDIVCRKERATGSRFETRVCKPQYQLTAQENVASERVHSAIASSESSGPANSGGPDVGNAVPGGAPGTRVTKDQAFRENMLSVLQHSPELQALGKKRDDLQARYETVTKGGGR